MIPSTRVHVSRNLPFFSLKVLNSCWVSIDALIVWMASLMGFSQRFFHRKGMPEILGVFVVGSHGGSYVPAYLAC